MAKHIEAGLLIRRRVRKALERQVKEAAKRGKILVVDEVKAPLASRFDVRRVEPKASGDSRLYGDHSSPYRPLPMTTETERRIEIEPRRGVRQLVTENELRAIRYAGLDAETIAELEGNTSSRGERSGDLRYGVDYTTSEEYVRKLYGGKSRGRPPRWNG